MVDLKHAVTFALSKTGPTIRCCRFTSGFSANYFLFQDVLILFPKICTSFLDLHTCSNTRSSKELQKCSNYAFLPWVFFRFVKTKKSSFLKPSAVSSHFASAVEFAICA